jgi:hypothetical protein
MTELTCWVGIDGCVTRFGGHLGSPGITWDSDFCCGVLAQDC